MEELSAWFNEELLGLVLQAIEISNVTDCENTQDSSLPEVQRNSVKDLTIIDYKIERAVKEGKNFCSTIYRASVLYRHNKNVMKKKHFIIKKLMSVSVGWFGDKEIQMYKVLPTIEQHIKSKLAPSMYICKNNALVMDDLNKQGFQTAKLKLLDFAHCEVALKALAKFHASSVLLHRDNPKLIEEKLGYESVNDTTADPVGFFQRSISRLSEEISMWPESKQYELDIQHIAQQPRTYFENLHKRNLFRVLNHGDFWLNNMLFRYDSDKVCEVRFVDFQICRFSPPTCDFQYFIGSSADLDVRLNRLDELIDVYLKTLNETLTQLGIAHGLTRQQFEDNMKQDYVMYFVGLVSPLGALMAEPNQTLDGTDRAEQNTTSTFCTFMKSKQYRDFVSPILANLEKRGVFQR